MFVSHEWNVYYIQIHIHIFSVMVIHIKSKCFGKEIAYRHLSKLITPTITTTSPPQKEFGAPMSWNSKAKPFSPYQIWTMVGAPKKFDHLGRKTRKIKMTKNLSEIEHTYSWINRVDTCLRSSVTPKGSIDPSVQK